MSFVHLLLLWLWLPMMPEKWEAVPWCVSLTLLMQRAQGEKHGVYSVPFSLTWMKRLER